MFKEKFNLLKSKLATITLIKYIQWYLDQDKKEGGIVNTPCVFIDFKDARINQLSKMTEEVTLPFDVIIYSENLKATEKINDDTNIHFELEESIQVQLKNFEKTGFTPVSKQPSGLIKSIISYQMHFSQGTSLSKNYVINNTPVVPVIDIGTE